MTSPSKPAIKVFRNLEGGSDISNFRFFSVLTSGEFWYSDRYNRILGAIYLENQKINLELLKADLAEFYKGKPPTDFDIEPFFWGLKNVQEKPKRECGPWVMNT